MRSRRPAHSRSAIVCWDPGDVVGPDDAGLPRPECCRRGYRLFRKELPWGWVRIREETGKGGTVVGVRHLLPHQEGPVAEDLYKQAGAASCSQVLVLVGDFNCAESCWRDSTAGHRLSRAFLEINNDIC